MVAATIQITDKPITFSGQMIKAILAGEKTQTRRVVTDERIKVLAPGYADDKERILGLCPYGRVGGRLWVREALRWTNWLVYDADHVSVDPDRIPANYRIGRDHLAAFLMPRWASRIALYIKEIRIERLHEIDVDDTCHEGIEHTGFKPERGYRRIRIAFDFVAHNYRAISPRSCL